MAKREIKFSDFDAEIKLRGREYQLAFKNVLDSGWFILGKEVVNFEQEFAKYLVIKHCIGVANGLEALQISLMALGIGPGDEVITTPISAVATTLSIMAVGATPVFVDTDEVGRIRPDLIAKAITKKTRAVMPVHLYGIPVDLGAIKKICKANKLTLIEDAGQAHGSTYHGRKLGTIGALGCFSFYPTKNLAAFGDGGAIVTNNKLLAEKCRQIRDYGQEGKYHHVVFGLNSRLDEVQAAILRIKLKYLDKDNDLRRKHAQGYVVKLNKLPEVQLISTEYITVSNFHLFVIRVKERDKLREFLKEQGIATLVHYPTTIPDQPMFNNKYLKLQIPEARKFVQEIISLPCHRFMKEEDVMYVAGVIKNYLD